MALPAAARHRHRPLPDLLFGQLILLREHWELLLASSGSDELAARLVAPVVRDLDQAGEALLTGERAEAIGRLVRDALILQQVRDRKRFVVGPYVRELRARISGLPPASIEEPKQDEQPDAEELAGPFRAWTLGELAEQAPEPEPIVDQAIDAFDAIALAPISPGNDGGPFTRLAPLMNEPQVRRAWSVTRRMAAADWGDDLSRAQASLLSRLAELGQLDEAEAMLPAIADADPRAHALGRIRGHRLLQSGEWRSPFTGEAPLLEIVRGLTEVVEAPSEALLEDGIGRLRTEPNQEARTGALVLMREWLSAASAERWLSLICECADGWLQVDLLFQLAVVTRTPELRPVIVQRAIERLVKLPDQVIGNFLDQIYAVREVLPLPEALSLFATIMKRAAHGTHTWLPQSLSINYDLVPMLRWLGGDAALRAVESALDEVARLLG